MSNRIYYSEEARRSAEQAKVVSTTLATLFGVIFGVMIALFWGNALRDKDQSWTESLGEVVNQTGEIAKVAKESVLANAGQVKETVANNASQVKESVVANANQVKDTVANRVNNS